jgi:hypothetical protein
VRLGGSAYDKWDYFGIRRSACPSAGIEIGEGGICEVEAWRRLSDCHSERGGNEIDSLHGG